MAFHDHISQEMALHYADHQLNDNVAVLRGMLPEHLGGQSSADGAGANKPTWLNSAILRQQSHHQHQHFGGGDGGSFLHLQTSNSDSSNSNQWLSASRAMENDDVNPVSGESMIATAMNNGNNDHEKSHNNINATKMNQQKSEIDGNGNEERDWEMAKCKADILAHPMYDELLSAHVSCLRIATPVDQLPRIDAQLAQSQQVLAKYSVLGHGNQPLDDKDLNQFMSVLSDNKRNPSDSRVQLFTPSTNAERLFLDRLISAHYVVLLSSFKEQLQQHVRVHAMEAVMACWELEQSLQSLTGVAPGEGTGATMSDDDDDQAESDANDGSLDGMEGMGFGLPTESERSLMERVRQELKHELKQGYKEKIVDIREEILRKRRAGKLPGDTTSLLKAWWQSHSKWPYPTEEDKARLVQETGLQLKQINNWFINQRKRNWHSNPSSSTVSKSKRKR